MRVLCLVVVWERILAEYIRSKTQCVGERRPNLALCIAGGARTFADGQVVNGLVNNFVEPFGANVTTFLYLKLQDRSTKGKDRNQNLELAADNHLSQYGDDEYILKEARRLPNLAKLDIIRHNVEFRHPPGCGKNRSFVADNSTGTAWRLQELWQMLVGQIYNQYWCGLEIEKYSKETGIEFDVVLKSRPDVTFLAPIPPYCAFDYATKACSARDWLFMLPGIVAVRALKRGYEEFLRCNTLMNRNKTKIAEIVVRATGMGKELLAHMGEADRQCKHCPGDDCPLCKRESATPLRLIRKKGVPSGSLPGALPRACGF